MRDLRRTIVFALTLLLATGLWAANQPTKASIVQQLRGLRSLPAAERATATVQAAKDIRTLPAGLEKVRLADGLSHLATEADPSHETLQAVADTLSQALTEHPLAEKHGQLPMPYLDLAKYIRYAHVTVHLNDRRLNEAAKMLAAKDAAIEKADFTLTDLQGRKVTLSKLRGKIVLVNFWATWCPPCRVEMPDLDAIYRRYQGQGLVVLSITDDDPAKVAALIHSSGYGPTVLLDSDGKVSKEFHILGIPKSFVFNRKGKLVAQSMDQCSQRQFLVMLSEAGLRQ